MNIFSKLKDFVGLNEPAAYEYDEYDEVDERGKYQNTYQEQNTQPTTTEEDNRQRRRIRERMSVVPETTTATTTTNISSTMNNVIGMPGVTNGFSEVLVMEPRTFEEMPQAIQALRERKSVVLNLTMMDPDQAQRAVDFIAGGTYAIDGHQERIGESIFLFTPSCVQVSTQSGVIHEVPQNQPVRPTRTTPAPNWTNPAEQRFIQSL
ncbi:cell division protein SepF [Phormidium sp. LEGE 05292]|uniref:cell division protein SepF n=1 Tax=[Phormidium] sp. LEGE 05292 TaxID=767427 RepID=UPI00187F28D7|nr:cell division protein SepF [Phormidium sp. LEGE 05292]MBE9226867.1 cell division protein SepF [Phormidium sp. LEGE 05292]